VVSLAPPIDRMENSAPPNRFRFGEFELDTSAGELRRNGDRLRIQPQPYRLLTLLVRRAGELVSRDEIRQELWKDGTFVDFEQSVNFCVSQIREVLKDSADRPLYVQTVPRRGYRFIAPVNSGEPRLKPGADGTTVRLQKALWTNIAELKLAEERRRQQLRVAIIVGLALLIAGLIALGVWMK
jgi:DNA-binding winged helix-turn-helix (wHTH) protein